MRAAASAIGAVIVATLGAGVASADKCTGAKLKAIARKERGLLACQAKVALRGGAVEPACDGKVIARFEAGYARRDPCGAPASGVCEAIADDCRDRLRVALPDGDATTPNKCEAARLKAAGRKAAAELGCYAKAAARNVAINRRCLNKGSRKFTVAFNRASGCAGDDRAATVEAMVDSECVLQLVSLDRTGRVTGICPVETTTTTAAPMGATTSSTTTAAPVTTTTTTTTTTVVTTSTTTATSTTMPSTTTSTAQVTTTTTVQTTTTTIPACDVCSTGPALDASCDPCAAVVCASTQDPACCAALWDAICVAEACAICGAPCPGTLCGG